jgi:hypothetical protein
MQHIERILGAPIKKEKNVEGRVYILNALGEKEREP